MAAPNVKFPREIRQGISGKDVIAHKRALARARPDLYKWADFTPLAGEFFMDAVVAWKKSRGLGRTRVFDASAIRLATQYHNAVTKSPEERIREEIISAARFWYTRRFSIPYVQARPFPLIKPPTSPRALDCSEFATICYFAGGAKDPNGRGFDGHGYTGTLMGRGTRVSGISQAKPGDLIFYGRSRGRPGFNAGDPTHVGLYVGKVNGVHMTFQMGSYPMKFVAYNYRSDLHHIERYRLV
jgi:cell wall-associated NlpC family hydrolase